MKIITKKHHELPIKKLQEKNKENLFEHISLSNWSFVMIFMMIFVMFLSLLNRGPGRGQDHPVVGCEELEAVGRVGNENINLIQSIYVLNGVK